MSWPFLAVLFSGWLYIDAAYRGPNWQRWLFRPITLLLLLLWAWQVPEHNINSYLIVGALLATLLSDILRIFDGKYLLPSLALVFLSYVLYMVSFLLPLQLSFYLPLLGFVILAFIIILAIVWTKLDKLAIPASLTLLAAFAMFWIAGEKFFYLSNDYNLSVMIGSLLLVIAYSIWLINRFCFSFSASKGLVSACYFIGHFFIVRALFL
ncbi:lysoplasmalogenase [Proteus terrae]|uniref:lysoplasmalogenase n=1 Tax=Proteus terrae TaxID=1574161 RepID=UPI001CC1A2A7|nr:lysoplasmalogenase family protein [Proteus terrae]